MENKTEQIERYISGELYSEELKMFGEKMKSNPEFAREVELYKEVNKAIQENDIIELRSKMKKKFKKF